MRTCPTRWLGLRWRLARAVAAAGVALAATACGGSGAARPSADSAAASGSATPSGNAAAPTLVVGGRYETLPGTIVCPTAAALGRVSDVARQRDTSAFFKALEDAGCSPVVAGAIVQVAEQQQAVARVRRAGDTSTYWTSADKLSPR
ncbi:hypothetical protein J421_5778 (plasmid) [Gemmatirosa kalamazoonensis]|uniref:Lipoprotein n=1 Tax=Gemmatirosa kalamazoonensis TaxID=861299 RepID=W0RUQ4_9BACT|nr:hypothetical protein [Gemmatirosa kalamazoonensis]AHG93313.1 hypothetical protein J421_5778 [Gemmatirosa kalamazoonensis]